MKHSDPRDSNAGRGMRRINFNGAQCGDKIQSAPTNVQISTPHFFAGFPEKF